MCTCARLYVRTYVQTGGARGPYQFGLKGLAAREPRRPAGDCRGPAGRDPQGSMAAPCKGRNKITPGNPGAPAGSLVQDLILEAVDKFELEVRHLFKVHTAQLLRALECTEAPPSRECDGLGLPLHWGDDVPGSTRAAESWQAEGQPAAAPPRSRPAGGTTEWLAAAGRSGLEPLLREARVEACEAQAGRSTAPVDRVGVGSCGSQQAADGGLSLVDLPLSMSLDAGEHGMEVVYDLDWTQVEPPLHVCPPRHRRWHVDNSCFIGSLPVVDTTTSTSVRKVVDDLNSGALQVTTPWLLIYSARTRGWWVVYQNGRRGAATTKLFECGRALRGDDAASGPLRGRPARRGRQLPRAGTGRLYVQP